MNGTFHFTVRVAGITVQFRLPNPIDLPPYLSALRCQDTQQPDECYTVELLAEPLVPQEPMVASVGEARIYQTEKGWLHLYPVLNDSIGCQVACLFCQDGNHTLYYPVSRWKEFSGVWQCAHLICGEALLLHHDALLLHSSCVLCNGQTVLFSGPSGIGKSTQAELWQKHLGAEIINGDRTVIRATAQGFWGSGSMWSGTSGIFSPKQAPIAGIFLLEQSTEDRVERLSYEAFRPLLTQTTVNSWDTAFMDRVTLLLSALIDSVPIYRLSCRPQRSAVELAYNTLFPTERSFL